MTEIWRRLAFYLLLFATLGTGIELIFLEHFEDPWQWAPIALGSWPGIGGRCGPEAITANRKGTPTPHDQLRAFRWSRSLPALEGKC